MTSVVAPPPAVGALDIAWDGVTRTFPRGTAIVVGRRADADVRVVDDRVSRTHALIAWRDGTWVITDQGSKNGIYTNGARVAEVAVTGSTVVAMGAPDGPALVLTAAGQPAVAATGGVVCVGRAQDNHVVVDDLLVSRHHCQLRAGENGWELFDLGSHNGTFVNGRAVRRRVLQPLDVVGLGQHLFRFVDGRLEDYLDRGGMSLQVQDVTVRTEAGSTLVDDVSFSLGDGGFLGIVGPSGCGKSTLLHAITGYRPADEGHVWYQGRDLYADYDALRQVVGFVPQDDVVHGSLTVVDALDYAAELRFPPDVSADERRQRVDEVIDELGLSERRDLLVRRLSGGQRKRVSVALELLTSPSLLFLDEPTSGLDPGFERSLMELLRALADGGRTVIVVTHSVRSLRLCDRVLVLAAGGRPAYFGPPQLAPAYFGCDDFEDVFKLLNAEPQRDWAGMFRAHPDFPRYVERRDAMVTASVSVPRQPPRPPRPTDPLRQFATLTRRYWKVLLSDRQTMVMLLLQAPLIGLLMLFVLPANELAPPPPGQLRLVSRAAIVIYQLVIVASWLGLSNATREIVKERAIFHRERAVGLSAWAYLSSKVVVLTACTVAQAIVLVLLATVRQGNATTGTVISWTVGELIIAVALAGLAALALGLFVSALAKSVDMATTLLPVLLVVLNVLAMGGTFPEIVEKPVLQQMTYVASSQYAFSAAASTVDLNHLQGINNVIRELKDVDLANPTKALPHVSTTDTGETRYDHRAEIWWANIGALVCITAAFLVVTGLVLDRRSRDLRS